MNALKLLDALSLAYRANLPVMLWGSPGIGKSAVVRQSASRYAKTLHEDGTAETHNLKLTQYESADEFCNAVSLIIFDPIELKGIPTVDNGRTVYTKSELIPESGSRVVVLFLDELVNAPRSVQASAYQLVLDRQLGSHKLPEYVRIVAAGNLSEDGGATQAMPTPLVSRFLHYRFELCPESWNRWAQAEALHPAVIAFVRWRSELLYTFSQDDASRGAYEDGHAYACPRTWEYVSKALHAGLPPGIEMETLAGLVGSSVATEFSAFLRTWETMPDLEIALQDPHNAQLPDSISACFAAAIGLSRMVDRSTLADAIAYMERLTDNAGNVRRDFVSLLVKQAAKHNPAIQNCSAFGDWSVRYGETLA